MSKWKKKVKKILIFLLVIFAGSSLVTYDTLVRYPEKIHKLKKTVVILETQCGENYFTGTGVLISKDGLILTASHVVSCVEEPFSITAYTTNFNFYPCVVQARNQRWDLALVQIAKSACSFPYAKIQKSDYISEATKVLVIGHPYGNYWTVSEGIVARVSFNFHYLTKMFEITAYINPGNSGGPVFNLKGEVIGIVSAKQMFMFGLVPGLGYAVHVINIHKFLKKELPKLKVKPIKRHKLGEL